MSNLKKFIGGIIASLSALTLVSVPVMALPQTVVYNNIASPQPPNVPSVGYEATSTSEFGGQIGLSGTIRSDPKVTVLMSSWACQAGSWTSGCTTTPGATFTHLVTLNIYEVGSGGSVGDILATDTETFTMPYRPTSTPDLCGGDSQKWYNTTTGQCKYGLAFPISFSFSGITLPNNVIIGVAYNTSNYGAFPLAPKACNTLPEGCPYDSLNVGIQTSLTVGSLPLPDDAYLNSSWAGAYCGGSTGTFRLDVHDDTQNPPCNWTGYQPSFKVEASAVAVAPPTNKDQCKKDGWMNFNNPSYKNQGACVSSVAVSGNPKAVANNPRF